MFTILIVEDDVAIREMLSMFLRNNDYKVIEAEDGETALDQLHSASPDLLILDWMLPDVDGVSLIPRIRKLPIHETLPVLMLTAKAEESDKLQGFENGADDYMTKPVSLKELHARIKALIRRSQGMDQAQLLSIGDISLNHQNKSVTIKDKPVKISGMEYRLLHFFMKNPERLYSRTQLLDNVWGQTVFVEERTVDVHIMRLRKILKKQALDYMLKTVRGSGYCFVTK